MRRTRGSRLVAAVVLVVGVALGGLAARTALAKSIVVLPRPGQVGVSLSGLYGTLLDGGNVGDQFGSGPGMALRMRYRMRYERGFGLTFESHGFDPRAADSLVDFYDSDGPRLAPNDPNAYKRLSLFLYGMDFYQMFGTRTKTTKMLSVGAGLAHPVFALNGGEQQYPFGDGVYLSAGAGIERFFWQSLAFDLGVRYQAVFLDSKANHDIQFSAGLVMYASL
jgi:hypothetical protein